MNEFGAGEIHATVSNWRRKEGVSLTHSLQKMINSWTTLGLECSERDCPRTTRSKSIRSILRACATAMPDPDSERAPPAPARNWIKGGGEQEGEGEAEGGVHRKSDTRDQNER